jgi:pilus assembly protein CpaC
MNAYPRTSLLARSVLAGLTLAALAAAAPAPATAQETRFVQIEANTAQAIPMKEAASEIFVSNPEIADVQANSPSLVYLFGKKPGDTTIFMANGNGKMLATLNVRVTHAVSRLRDVVKVLDPTERVRIDSVPGAIVLSGPVDSPSAAETITRAAEAFLVDAGKERVINRLTVTAPTQVSLRVRVAEVSRTVNQQLGINWNTAFSFGGFTLGLSQGRNIIDTSGSLTGLLAAPQNDAGIPGSYGGTWSDGNNTVNTVVDALAKEGLVTILAEPNLTALSGETASFLAGGEFPIPIAQQNNALSIEFKQFGVSLAFTPTVLDDGRISLKVRPEVSDVNNALGIKLSSTTVPGISTRRAETTVELASGQSFAIGGLLQNSLSTDLGKTPGLGDLPVLGPLFRSSNFQRKESELVILVTPILVRPVSSKALQLPTDGLEMTSQMDRFLNQRLARVRLAPGSSSPVSGSGVRLVGPSGFIVE